MRLADFIESNSELILAEWVEFAAKSGPADHAGNDTSAEVHGAVRAEGGFTLGEMISEFRALRAASVPAPTSPC